MERTIRILTEMRDKAERSFIENSLIVHRSRLESPIPDTKSDLEMIIELNQAIITLKNSTMDEITIEELKNNNSKRVSILTYRGEGDPVRKLDDKIQEYTNGEPYWEFIDMNMDNPWTRIIVFGEL